MIVLWNHDYEPDVGAMLMQVQLALLLNREGQRGVSNWLLGLSLAAWNEPFSIEGLREIFREAYAQHPTEPSFLASSRD